MATVFTQKNATLTGGAGSYTITGSYDNIIIGNGNVTLSDTTSSLNNIYTIGSGTDILTFYGAGDQISVAAGTDTITMRGANESLTVADGGKNTITMYGAGDSAVVGISSSTVTAYGTSESMTLLGGTVTAALNGTSEHVTFGDSASAYTVKGLVGSDVLDFSRLLPGKAASDLGDCITQSHSGGNLLLAVAGAAGVSQITLVGYTGTLDALISNHQIIG